MRIVAGSLWLSPTDLSLFLGCRHRTGLDLSEARGLLGKGDLFLDLEGARFAREGGREFLFGLWSSEHRAWWAYDDMEERAAFEAVVDLIMQAWAADPAMHVYRVGVTAVSHKVIRNLLDAVHKQAAKAGKEIRLAHKVSEKGEDVLPVWEIEDNETALAALREAKVDVLGGTAWLWAREDAAELADVLIVDEAGQMSLANALAVSQAAKSLVLLGDPQQLEQPQKGSHPDGVKVSALEHVLGAEKTMPVGRGIFLPITWRLAPAVCAFTSEMFYARKAAATIGTRASAARRYLCVRRRRTLVGPGGARRQSELVVGGSGCRHPYRGPSARRRYGLGELRWREARTRRQ